MGSALAQVDIRTIDFWGFPRSNLRRVFVRARRRAITVPLAGARPHGSALLALRYRQSATAPATIACSCRSRARAARRARCSCRICAATPTPTIPSSPAAKAPPDRAGRQRHGQAHGQEGRHQRGCIAALAAARPTARMRSTVAPRCPRFSRRSATATSPPRG